MHVLDSFAWLMTPLSFSGFSQSALELLAYVGPGPGPELIPYFLALLSFLGVALIALVQRPISILLGYLSKARRRRHEQTDTPAGAANPCESQRDATKDRA